MLCILYELNSPGMYVMYDVYDFVTTTVLKSHVSNSIVNLSCKQYVDIMHMAYYEQVDMRMTVLLLPVLFLNRKMDIDIVLCCNARKILKFTRISRQSQKGRKIHTYLLLRSIEHG